MEPHLVTTYYICSANMYTYEIQSIYTNLWLSTLRVHGCEIYVHIDKSHGSSMYLMSTWVIFT